MLRAITRSFEIKGDTSGSNEKSNPGSKISQELVEMRSKRLQSGNGERKMKLRWEARRTRQGASGVSTENIEEAVLS